jgi:hypothetical protein
MGVLLIEMRYRAKATVVPRRVIASRRHGPLTIASVQVDVYVAWKVFAGTERRKVSVTFAGPVPVADAAL